MKLISEHIRILLHQHDCVVVPGLGGFILNQFPASYDEKNAVYYPKRRLPLFNKQLQSNDGLLAAALVKSQGYSYPDAVKEIQRFVDQVKESIEQKRSYPLVGLGEFDRNHEGQITFFPDKQSNSASESFGLGSLEIRPLSKSAQKQRTALKPLRNKGRRWVAVAASVLFTIFSGYIISEKLPLNGVQWSTLIPFNEILERYQTVKPIAGENIGQMGSIITEPEIIPENTDTVTKEESVSSSNDIPVIKPTTEITSDSIYLIVVGAFQIEKNASIYAEELKNSGFSSLLHTQADSKLVRVAAEKHPQRNLAETRLTLIKRQINAGAWILALPNTTR